MWAIAEQIMAAPAKDKLAVHVKDSSNHRGYFCSADYAEYNQDPDGGYSAVSVPDKQLSSMGTWQTVRNPACTVRLTCLICNSPALLCHMLYWITCCTSSTASQVSFMRYDITDHNRAS